MILSVPGFCFSGELTFCLLTGDTLRLDCCTQGEDGIRFTDSTNARLRLVVNFSVVSSAGNLFCSFSSHIDLLRSSRAFFEQTVSL